MKKLTTSELREKQKMIKQKMKLVAIESVILKSVEIGNYSMTNSEMFQIWADNLEKSHKLGIYKKPINTIANHIRKKIITSETTLDNKERLLVNLSRSLPNKYKTIK